MKIKKKNQNKLALLPTIQTIWKIYGQNKSQCPDVCLWDINRDLCNIAENNVFKIIWDKIGISPDHFGYCDIERAKLEKHFIDLVLQHILINLPLTDMEVRILAIINIEMKVEPLTIQCFYLDFYDQDNFFDTFKRLEVLQALNQLIENKYIDCFYTLPGYNNE